MRVLRIVCLLLCVLLLVACDRAKDFDAGEPLSAEQMAALQDSLRDEAPEEESEDEAEPPASEDTQSCYYTPNGSVWHLDATCHYLVKSKNVITATVREAIEQGKTKPCSHCGVIKEEKNG